MADHEKPYDEDHESDDCHVEQPRTETEKAFDAFMSMTPEEAVAAGRQVGGAIRLVLDRQKALRKGFLEGILETAEGDEAHVEIGGHRVTNAAYQAIIAGPTALAERLKAENDRLRSNMNGMGRHMALPIVGEADVPCTPWRPQFGDEMPSVQAAIRQAIGAASVCWDKDGVFLSDQANWIAEGLVAFLGEQHATTDHLFFPEDKAHEVLGLFGDDAPAMEQWERAEAVGQVVNGWFASVKKGWGIGDYERPPVEPTVTDAPKTHPGASFGIPSATEHAQHPGVTGTYRGEDGVTYLVSFESALQIVCEECGAPIGQDCIVEPGKPRADVNVHASRLQATKVPVPVIMPDDAPTYSTTIQGEGHDDVVPEGWSPDGQSWTPEQTVVYIGGVMDLTADLASWLRSRIPMAAARKAAHLKGEPDPRTWIESLAWDLARKMDSTR